VEAWLARRASGGGPRTGGGGKSAEAEGGTDEEDRQLQRAIAGLLLSLQLPMELLAAEGDDGAQGADQLLGVALPRVEYLQVVVHLAEPGGGVLLQNSLQKGVALPQQGLGGLSGIEGVGAEGEPVVAMSRSQRARSRPSRGSVRSCSSRLAMCWSWEGHSESSGAIWLAHASIA